MSVEGRRRRVLLVGDVLAPRRRVAFLVDLDHREMRHEPTRRGAVPVLLAGLEEDAVTRADHLDRAAAPLAVADALRDTDSLAVRVRVPGGARAGREVDAARVHARPVHRRGDGVEVDRPREPLAWAGRGLHAVSRDLHHGLRSWMIGLQAER